ncbi:hypothetical protein [Synechococcus sp. PCC 7502]|nr:hypothetical protein [Synechococcus sp. PCC 7502]
MGLYFRSFICSSYLTIWYKVSKQKQAEKGLSGFVVVPTRWVLGLKDAKS